MTPGDPQDVWRECAPHVLGALVRRYGDFDAAEDALQDALLAAARHWPTDGRPADPTAWLVRAASRRLVDRWRADHARAEREQATARRTPPDEYVVPGADVAAAGDDSLWLLLLCCRPAFPLPAQVALTLRAVGGLRTAQIARAFLVPEATMAQGAPPTAPGGRGGGSAGRRRGYGPSARGSPRRPRTSCPPA